MLTTRKRDAHSVGRLSSSGSCKPSEVPMFKLLGDTIASVRKVTRGLTTRTFRSTNTSCVNCPSKMKELYCVYFSLCGDLKTCKDSTQLSVPWQKGGPDVCSL